MSALTVGVKAICKIAARRKVARPNISLAQLCRKRHCIELSFARFGALCVERAFVGDTRHPLPPGSIGVRRPVHRQPIPFVAIRAHMHVMAMPVVALVRHANVLLGGSELITRLLDGTNHR
jgi:hypothetical protein